MKIWVTIILLLVVGVVASLVWHRGKHIPKTDNGGIHNDLITVATPEADALVSSPVTITGEARGYWYFEASFPVKIVDANNVELGAHHAEAQSDWMTSELVPFVATVTFATSTTETGFIILEKDNPSGLPENAGEIRVSIRFR